MLIYAVYTDKYMTAIDAQPIFHFSFFVQPATVDILPLFTRARLKLMRPDSLEEALLTQLKLRQVAEGEDRDEEW